MEIAFWEAVKRHLPGETPQDAVATWQRNIAAALMNLSVLHRARGRLDAARAALGSAADLANAAGHPGLKASIHREAATLAWQANEKADKVLELWRESISAAVEDGAASQLVDGLIGVVRVLLRLGEYDLASAELDRTATQLPLVVSKDPAQLIEIARAEIDARRGMASSALNRLRPMVDQYPADTPAGARVRAALARFIGYHAPLRALAVELLDEILAAMRTKRLPERGLSDVPERASLEGLRAAILVGGGAAIIKLIQVSGRDEEALLRGQLVLAELTHFQSIVPMIYERLCQLKRAESRWLRVIDLAQGLVYSARRSGDAERELAAIHFYYVAFALIGQVDVAIQGLEMSLATAAAGPHRDAIARNLNTLRQGTGRPLAEVASVPEVDKSLPPHEARIWAMARGLLDRNDLDGALLVLLRAREAAT